MSLQDVVHQPPLPPSRPPPPSSRQSDEQISDSLIDEISIPNINPQIFGFCDADIFPDTLQSSEVTSSPNCYCYEDQNSSYAIVDNNDTKDKFSTNNKLDISSLQRDQTDQNNGTNTSASSSTTTTATTPATSRHNNHHNNHHNGGGLSIIFDTHSEIDNDISASIDFSPSPLPLTDVAISNNGLNQYSSTMDPVALPLMAGCPPHIGPFFEEDCFSSVPSFVRLNPSATAAAAASGARAFLDPASMSSFLRNGLNHGLSADNSGIFGAASLLMPSDIQHKELEFQAENSGIFCSDQLPHYSSGDMQAFSNENSQLVSAATSSAPISTEISSMEDSSFKVGKLSVEQRKEKIHRYMKKRNERNFSKKIKYACRKTLADSRPRVRGRFAKNDEFGESHRHMNHHDDDDYDEVTVKEEDDLVDSSDIFAHISGVNSFKCSYQHFQSWI